MEESLEVTFSMRSWVLNHESEVGVDGYQSGVLSCFAKRRYQATTSEDIEDFMCAVVTVIFRVCKSVRLL
jgi:hypothetical protein